MFPMSSMRRRLLVLPSAMSVYLAWLGPGLTGLVMLLYVMGASLLVTPLLHGVGVYALLGRCLNALAELC